MQPTASSSSDPSVGVSEGQREDITSLEGMVQAPAAHPQVEPVVRSTSYHPGPPPTLRFSWDGTEGNPERNFSAWKIGLESRPLAMDGISDRFKIATIWANVHGAVRNWFLAHPEWARGNAGPYEDLLHQFEKEFTTNWATHDRATELHTTYLTIIAASVEP
ncbi:hypothetical protein POJ06DRAFT_19918 [Lipomyces tetrasporus]|uniref:Retrotransposon gag domain-containing protein n=1 Tax=Lipomyces tetrasporus TaxID=54092 RepID=A0AAD7VPZ5_9ASCO|nr:uncharacterized protein POJ06DRAFT_19918 [Lipomyces tetrasporus]KAJ8097703.1 hypothetical protein POJ06DRAFT_19918 [Lipomyces tetrasporus]